MITKTLSSPTVSPQLCLLKMIINILVIIVTTLLEWKHVFFNFYSYVSISMDRLDS